jgi:hypothetical protein
MFWCHFDWIGGNAAINLILFVRLSMIEMAVTFMRPILIATMRRWQPVRLTRAVETWICLAVSVSPSGDHGQVFHSSFLNTILVPCGSRCVIEGLGKVSNFQWVSRWQKLNVAFIRCNFCNSLTVTMPTQTRSCKFPVCSEYFNVYILHF